MPSFQKFEFTDPSNCDSETDLAGMSGGKKNGGCYVSGPVGVAITLLAVLIAVGVGLIVYFAAGDKDIVCQWGGVGELATSDAVKQQCVDLATDGNQDICGQCPSQTTVPSSHDVTTTPSPDSTASQMLRDVRLPTSVYPEHYDVKLQPYMYSGDKSQFTFKGHVRIIVMCKEATDNITLHINILQVNTSSISFKGFNPMANDPVFTNIETDEARQFFIVRLSANMKADNRYVLEMSYTAPLKPDLKGLYLSTYTRDNETVYLATSQMQPTDARKTFPCFDEPAIKATFNITLVRPDYLVSISNTPIMDNSTSWVEDGITFVEDVYEKTPKMSTYLLAFVICDFKYKSSYTKNGVLYRAWAVPGSVDEVETSLEVGVKVLDYFGEYFEVDFPLPKQDMIAVPDFSLGAMENWGLVVYRETYMLYKPGVSTEHDKMYVNLVVTHELAHQWFGNLVTPAWWDDLWLNEGFATYMEYLGMGHNHPDWNVFDTFISSDLQDALSSDGLVSSHPLFVPVYNPDQIDAIFDSISYKKGASVIRMMRHFLGEETFRKGVVNYLKKNAYGAVSHDDLWEALSEQATQDGRNINVKDVMDTWTLQMNYPVVTVSRDFNQLDKVHVSQHRYLVDPEAEELGKYTSPFGYKWSIPLTFTSSRNPNFQQNHTMVHWIDLETEKTFTLGESSLPTHSDQNGWILANVNQYGYYRVNYQLGNWENLAKALKTDHTVIPISNRAQIINDAWNLAKSGHISLKYALMTTDYLNSETDYVPWAAASAELSYVSRMLSLSPLRGAFKSYMKDKLTAPFTHYGLDTTGATHVETEARDLIAHLACSYNIQSCLDAASQQYATWMQDPATNGIDPNIKSVVYCYAVANGGWTEWNFALERYKVETVASEKRLLFNAMSCTKEPWILNKFLYLVVEENSPIKRQDADRIISDVSRNIIGRSLAWDFFRAHFDRLKILFGLRIPRVVRAVTGSFNTEFHLQEIIDFENSKKGQLASGERAFQQAKEKTRSNIKWMEKNVPILEAWFEEKGY